MNALMNALAEWPTLLDMAPPSPARARTAQEHQARRTRTTRALMVEDMQLADDIRPADRATTTIARVLLTGATGFLGSHTLLELLAGTDWHVVCLVRADDDAHAAQRVAAALLQAGLEPERVVQLMGQRVSARQGQVALPDYGWNSERFDALARSVDAVIHGAAEVSWIKPYRGLRGSHVMGTRNAIRLACRLRSKALYVVSTLAVCYAHDGPEHIDEGTDMLPHVERLPLGYAQAKCIGETLLRQAAQRGLRVGILRSGLLSGHSRTGVANHKDLISRLVGGCVQSGLAADVDWQLDCVPVDTAAQTLRAMVQSGFARSGQPQVLHLQHDAPRSWRELVLSLCLRGHALRLAPLAEWLQMIEQRSEHEAPDLHVLRPFFLAGREEGGPRSIEIFFEPTRQRIQSLQSQQWLLGQGIAMPRFDARLLNCYLDHYAASGQLGQLPSVDAPVAVDGGDALRERLQAGLRQQALQPGLVLSRLQCEPLGADSGLLSQLGAARSGGRSGVWRVQGQLADGAATCPLDAVLKLKVSDAEQDAITLAVAGLCSPALQRAFREHLPGLPYRGSAGREQAIALLDDARLTRHMPATLAVLPEADGAPAGMLYEYLGDADLLDSVDQPERWGPVQLHAAAQGLGEMHAAWLGRHEALQAQPWIAAASCGPDLAAMHGLWDALACHAAPCFSELLGVDTLGVQRRWVDEMPAWWAHTLALPRSLIHHDCNPRNLAFRRRGDEWVLCAYDWELATLGLPQYDLIELLCFVLPEQQPALALQQASATHRRALEAASSSRLDARSWQAGLPLALRYFVTCRLPMYTLIDRFRPQPFLPRVLRNTWWLARHFGLV